MNRNALPGGWLDAISFLKNFLGKTHGDDDDSMMLDGLSVRRLERVIVGWLSSEGMSAVSSKEKDQKTTPQKREKSSIFNFSQFFGKARVIIHNSTNPLSLLAREMILAS